MFYGRIEELDFLQRKYEAKGGQFIVLYRYLQNDVKIKGVIKCKECKMNFDNLKEMYISDLI